MSLVCLLHVSYLLDEQNWCVMRLLKAASSMATISICLAKPPVIHMSASVWQTMRLGQSQWQNVGWWFLSNCSNASNCKNDTHLSFCFLFTPLRMSWVIFTDREDPHRKKAEEWQSCKREETCNPKWLTDPETILGTIYWCLRGWIWLPWDSQTQDWQWTNLSRWNPARLSGLWHLDDWDPLISSWIGLFWRLRLETLRMWDKPYGSKSLTGIRLWNMCCHPTKATFWIKLNPFDTRKHDSADDVEILYRIGRTAPITVQDALSRSRTQHI